jgi:hypothetical protein
VGTVSGRVPRRGTGAGRPVVAWAAALQGRLAHCGTQDLHFTRRAWGGRKARTRRLARNATDLATRAGAFNWARLAVLGLDHDPAGWALRAT